MLASHAFDAVVQMEVEEDGGGGVVCDERVALRQKMTVNTKNCAGFLLKKNHDPKNTLKMCLFKMKKIPLLHQKNKLLVSVKTNLRNHDQKKNTLASKKLWF
jgi:hypothetical protein